MENYALHVPEKMIHDSGGGKKMSGTFLTVVANPNSITIQSIRTPSLKPPSSCEFDFQQGLDRNNGFGGLEEHSRF